MYPPFFESPGESPGRSCHSLWATARLSTSLALQTAPPQEESGGETVRRGAAAPHLGPRRDLRHTLAPTPVSYTHLRAHETDSYLVCRLLLEKKKKQHTKNKYET